MKWLFTLLSIILPLHAVAQKIYIYPAEVIAPRGTYQSVTVVINGVNDKTVTWSASGGRIVGANPCVVNEPCTVALYSKETGTFHLKATSNANHSVTAESTITFTPSPTPVTSHPRLLVTQAMLPTLRARATSHNVVYQGMKEYSTAALERDNAVWSWSCKGGSGQPRTDQGGGFKEYDAQLFAFLSLVAPTATERDQWGCYGRDVWVYVMEQVLAGKESIGGVHWADSSPMFALTTDWLMGGNYLTAADQVLARRFLAYLAKLAAGDYGTKAGTTKYNSYDQFIPNDKYSLVGVRALGNNYTLAKTLIFAGAALTFNDDETDDPALSNSCRAKRYEVCPDYSAGSLHAYFHYLTGGMLYLMYAHLEDPGVSLAAYQAAYSNLPQNPQCAYTDLSKHPCFGDGRGGESSEGSWYQFSMNRSRYMLNMLHTAGYDDPILYGPQISLGTSSWWDMKYVSDILFLTGIPPEGAPTQPSFNYLTTGDSLSYTRMPFHFSAEAAMMAADSYVGRKDRTEALRWLLVNSAFGGPLGTLNHCKNWCGFDSTLHGNFGVVLTPDLFIAMSAPDPVSPLPADPRPSLPSDLYNGSYNQHTILRTKDAGGSVLFSTYCPNTLIDHEHQFCGRFDIFSNNEYITKGRTEFNDYNNMMSSATQSNNLSVQNVGGSGCTEDCFMYSAVQNGGQFWHQLQAGFNLVTHSELPSYAAFLYNDTPSYNAVQNEAHELLGYTDVTKVSRSMVYLRSTNQLIYYDRAATRHPSAKAVYQITTGVPTVSGNEATWLTRSGKQRAYLTSLVPTRGTMARLELPKGGEDQLEDWEPAANVEISAGNPMNAQFLTVLEWGGSSMHKSPTAAVDSTAGQAFDGAKVGSSVVMFMRNWPETFTAVTYPASGATTQYVSDLQPNMPYQISGDGAPTSGHSDSAGVLTFPSAGTGSIHVSASK